MKSCDRCGHPAVDVVGTRQTSLFDVPADPRATAAARAELRAGRVLCSACQRAEELFPTVAPIKVTAPPSHFLRALIDHWTETTGTAIPVDDLTDPEDEEETGESISACEDRDNCDPVGTADAEEAFRADAVAEAFED